ncbi:glutamate 5-kinase [Candidatus Bathyarchaeota archaeon]|nr:glutamate 5-kinase [Candidatus Bathyarchaeota archaeon]
MSSLKRDFEQVKRIVIKIGTSVLTKSDGSLDKKYMREIAGQVCSLAKKKKEVILVSSGAIGSGVKELGLGTMPRDIPTRQGAAAVGQSILMEAWREAFRKRGAKVAQILLTYDAFSNRRTYLNLRNSMSNLAKYGVIPIINENDPIAVHEIEATFGDNDKLSALVAAKVDAELLILLTDVDGLYDKNPKRKDAKLISEITEITHTIERIGGEPGSWRSKGGMKTKIEAAKISVKSNCNMVIANAHEKNGVTRILQGEEVGTLFRASKNSYTNKERWIRFSKSHGNIKIDKGAKDALLRGGSLLPSGILEVKGEFNESEVVTIVHNDQEIAKVIVDYSSEELLKIKGKQTDQIEKILGYKNYDNIFRRENMAPI